MKTILFLPVFVFISSSVFSQGAFQIGLGGGVLLSDPDQGYNFELNAKYRFIQEANIGVHSVFGISNGMGASNIILVNAIFEYDDTQLTDNLSALIQLGTGGINFPEIQEDRIHLNFLFGGGFKYKIQKKLELGIIGNYYAGDFQNFGTTNLILNYYFN